MLLSPANSSLLQNEHTNTVTHTLKSFLVRTEVYLRKVTCPLRVNFEFFIKIAKIDHLELTFNWWQFFLHLNEKKIAPKVKLAST